MLSKLGPFVQNIHNNCTFGILSARFVEDEHFVPTRWNVEDRDRPSAIPTAPWNLIRESDGRHLANLPKSTTLSRIFPSLFFFPLPPFSRTRDQCHHQHPFYSNFVHFVSLVQPLVKLLEPPSRVSCVVREYRVLDLSSRTIPPISLLLIASKKKFFCFWKVNFQEEKIFLKFLFSPFKFPCYLSLQRTKRNERRTRNLFTPFLYFSRFFLFFLFSSSTIPSLCRLSTNVSRKRFTSYHGVTPRRRNTIIRVSPGILEGSFTPFASFAWVRVTSFTDQLLLSFSFFFLSKEEPGEKVSLGCRKKQSRSHLMYLRYIRVPFAFAKRITKRIYVYIYYAFYFIYKYYLFRIFH